MKNLIKYSGLLRHQQPLNIILKTKFFGISLFFCLLLGLSQVSIAQETALNLHTVSTDETLFAIAKRYETSVDEIVSTNQLVGKTIYVGQRLYIPSNATISAQAPTAESTNDRPLTVERQGFYITIAPGESLLGIALRYGVAIGELATVNNIVDVTNIPAGSSLYIPATQNTLPATQVVAISTPAAEQLQTVAQGSGFQDNGLQNIQIVATRHRIGAGSDTAGSTTTSSTTTATAYPNGPQVRIGVAAAPVSPPQIVPPQVVTLPNESNFQPVGGFVPQDQSPKQQLLQQQMVLLRQSGPQLSIFQPPLQEFSWPLEIKGRISSNYGSRKLAITSNRFHYGLDLAAATGTAVLAAKSGKVKEAAWIGGYGNAVYIDHPDGTQTRYAHMSKLNVSAGDTVAQGDVIGKVGSTGVSTGPHLHFEIRVKGYAVDPLEYIAQP